MGLSKLRPIANDVGTPMMTGRRQAMAGALGDWRHWLGSHASEAGRALFAPIVDYLEASGEEPSGSDPLQRDPQLIAAMAPLLKALQLYMGAEVRGFENIPRDEPVLIVGNHSGGAFTLDGIPLLMKWIETRGCEAPLYSLGYQLFFASSGVGNFFRRMGALPACHRNAREALDKGASVIVLPGGDHEVFRPWRERNRIDFAGRTGFIELAIKAGVRVVPMTTHGAHESTWVLTRGRRIARELGLDKLRIKVFPLIWSVPFGVVPAFVPSLSLPSRVTVQLGAPMDWSKLGPEAAEDPEVLRRCYEQVVGSMQRTMDALAAEHPYPVLARLNDMRPTRVMGRAWRMLSREAGSQDTR